MPEPRRQKGQRAWPYHALKALRRAIDQLRDVVASLKAAREARAHGRHEVADVHTDHALRLSLDTLLVLRDAEDGEPDDLALALTLLARSIEGADVHHDARELLARYEELAQ